MRCGGPWNAVTASANQHSDPALSPQSTIPRSQHSRSTSSMPCAPQTPSSETTLPPPT